MNGILPKRGVAPFARERALPSSSRPQRCHRSHLGPIFICISRRCKLTNPYEFTRFLLGSTMAWQICNRRKLSHLNQTGANCFLRFDIRSDERGVQGRGDGGGRFRLRWPPGLSAPSLQTPTWPRRALNMPENHSERWGASTERRRGLDPRVATWA